MRRTAARAFASPFLAFITVAFCFPVAAQAGPWGAVHPLWVDKNGNGAIDQGEMLCSPHVVGGDHIELANNPWDTCAGFVTKVYYDSLNPPTTVFRPHVLSGSVAKQQVTFTSPTTAYFLESVFRDGAFLDRAIGHASLTRQGGTTGGAYTGIHVEQTFSATGKPNFSTDIDFVYKDIDGDGMADYITIPWAVSNVFGVKQSNSCLGGASADPQIMMPLADTNGDGKPDTVAIDLDGDGRPDPGLIGPLLVPSEWQTAVSPNQIPTLSEWGMFILAASFSGLGWWLLSRGGAGA